MQKPESQNNFNSNAILGREKLEEKKMKDMLAEAVEFNPFYFNADWNEFKDDYSRVATPEIREKMVKTRKQWIEMKELGSSFEEFITEQIMDIADEEDDNSSRLFAKIHIYESLSYPDGPEFLAEVLNSKKIIGLSDGSYSSTILEYLRSAKDEKTSPQIMSFIEKATGPEYGRKKHLDGDIYKALGTVNLIAGREKTIELIEDLAEKSTGFKEWLINQKIQGDDVFDRLSEYVRDNNLVIEPFDKQRELNRLQELDQIPLPPPEDDSDYGEWDRVEPYSYLEDSYVADSHNEVEAPIGQPQSELLRIAEKVRRMLSSKTFDKINQRVSSAAKLHIYNVMKDSPGGEISQKDIDKIQRMSDIEKKYAEKKDLLPTIGIEIETPATSLSESTQQVLMELYIPNDIGSTYPIKLWEVKPDYSHSPLVQSRILQELADMEAIPIDKKTGKLPRDARTSLHLNFGFLKMNREEIDSIRGKYLQDIELLNDLLTYAFASPYRIQNRKTHNSYEFKTSRDEDEMPFNREGKSSLIRLELRAGEFRDYPTFRLLAEAQALVGSMIADVKIEENYIGRQPTDAELKLALLWPKVKEEIRDYLKQYSLKSNMVDIDPDEAARVMGITGFKEGCRKIISKYAKMVLREVFHKEKESYN
jgi:hypothetical protein